MQAGEGDGRETWTCDDKDCGKCEGIHEMLLSEYLEPGRVVDWIRDQGEYDIGFLMGRELSQAQNTQHMDCLQELLSIPLQQMVSDGGLPDWGEFAHLLAGVVDGDGHRIVVS